MYDVELIIGNSTELYGDVLKVIRKIRKQRHMTLEELAEKSGVSRVNINRYELGSHEPKVSAAIKIAKALDCSVEELMEEPASAGADS